MKGRGRRWLHAWHRVAHSLRARLVLLFLLLALATAAVFLFGMQRLLATGWQSWAQPLVGDYLDRLAAEIGDPPDAAKAQALAQRLPVRVRIEGPRVNLDTHPGQDRHQDWKKDWRRHQGDEARYWRLTRSTADGHQIIFGLAWPAPGDSADRPQLIGWFTLGGLLLLTAMAYAVVRRLLRPLQAIGEGVARFGRGEFEPPIPVVRHDELGDLAERVNRMAGGLRGMLEDQRALLLAISHELRSPLTRARLNAELVDEGEARSALLHDLGEMRDLINSLLESERIAAGAKALQLETVDLAALAAEAADTAPGAGAAGAAALPGAARRGITLDLDPNLPPVRADATRLRLLLRNLIDNARRHGGEAAAPAQLFLRREADGRMALGLRDHGPGVPDELLPRLSEAFYRPDSARTRAAGGVGLGLYLCRLVAQAHGGELRIRNTQPGLEVAMVWRPA